MSDSRKLDPTDKMIGWLILVALLILIIRSFVSEPKSTTVINLYQEKKLEDARPNEDTTPQTQPSLTPGDQQQINCLTQNIYYEARGQTDVGKLAIALVTFNRIKDGFAHNVCGVVYQKTIYKKHVTWQFSWVGQIHDFKIHEPEAYNHCYRIAHNAYVQQMIKKNPIHDITGGAHFYYANLLIKAPSWARTPKHKHTAIIEDHSFYR